MEDKDAQRQSKAGRRRRSSIASIFVAALLLASAADAADFLPPNPDPGLTASDPVYLDRFQFFKSGTPDSATNIRLVILNGMFVNLAGLTTSSPGVVGLSTNTVANTTSLSTGNPITFRFDDLALVHGNNYAAMYGGRGGSEMAGGAPKNKREEEEAKKKAEQANQRLRQSISGKNELPTAVEEATTQEMPWKEVVSGKRWQVVHTFQLTNLSP